MESSKGISLPIKAVVVLTLAIIVLLAVIALFTSTWQDEPINETAKDAEGLLDDVDLLDSQEIPNNDNSATEESNALKNHQSNIKQGI